ncbi:MAG: formimidoylglutamase [Chloroflexi bacterium]|nr:formimidoylglutamase [Chloroflexota bacterium]
MERADQLFAILRGHTDESLFYTRNDPNDRRLGEYVRHDIRSYERADVVILGCPQDEGVRRNGGRVGAAAAPAQIRRWLYRLTVHGMRNVSVIDLGDTPIQLSLEDTHALHQQVVAQVIHDGKRLIVLGGGNDIAYPDCAGLVQAAGDVLALNIDAHFDVRADVPRNSGTPYRQLIEAGLLNPAQFYEVGYQPYYNSPVYEQYLHEKGAHLISMPELRVAGIAGTIGNILAQQRVPYVFWGFDLDVVRAADAPGVSAPNPMGLSGEELCMIAGMAGADVRTRLVEFSEVNPGFDLDGRTCRLTAIAIWNYLAALSTVH